MQHRRPIKISDNKSFDKSIVRTYSFKWNLLSINSWMEKELWSHACGFHLPTEVLFVFLTLYNIWKWWPACLCGQTTQSGHFECWKATIINSSFSPSVVCKTMLLAASVDKSTAIIYSSIMLASPNKSPSLCFRLFYIEFINQTAVFQFTEKQLHLTQM